MRAGAPLPTSTLTGVVGPLPLARFGVTMYVEPSAGRETHGASAAGTVVAVFADTVTVAPVHVSAGGVGVLDLLHAATTATPASATAAFRIRIVCSLA